jgi:hypothetical protein
VLVNLPDKDRSYIIQFSTPEILLSCRASNQTEMLSYEVSLTVFFLALPTSSLVGVISSISKSPAFMPSNSNGAI